MPILNLNDFGQPIQSTGQEKVLPKDSQEHILNLSDFGGVVPESRSQVEQPVEQSNHS